MRLLQKKEVREEGAGAVVLPEPTTDAAEAVVLTEPTTAASSARTQQGKKRRRLEGEAADKSVRAATDEVSLSLEATRVVEAIKLLEALPPGEHVDELRDLLLQWRAGATVQGRRRDYFRKVAVKFRGQLPRNSRNCSLGKFLDEIAAAFIARVSALCLWHRGTASGAGEPASSGVGEAAVGVLGSGAGEPAAMGKRKAKAPAGEESNAAAGLGIEPQRSRRRRNREATAHEVGGEGGTAGEPIAPGAGGPPALAGGSLARFIVHRAPDAQCYRMRSVRIEDIVTIEDASMYAREHSKEIPGELFKRVWEVRAEMQWKRLRELACTYSIRKNINIKKNSCTKLTNGCCTRCAGMWWRS